MGARSASSCRRIQFRQTPEDLERFYVRSTSGKMIPVSELVTLSGATARSSSTISICCVVPTFSAVRRRGTARGQALQAMEEVAAKVPPGFTYAWTTMAYQEKAAAPLVPSLSLRW